jgi:hypothetical protein
MSMPESSLGPSQAKPLTEAELVDVRAFHERAGHIQVACDACAVLATFPDEYAEATNAAMNYGDGYANALQELAADMGRRLIPGVHYSREWIIEVINEFGRNRP